MHFNHLLCDCQIRAGGDISPAFLDFGRSVKSILTSGADNVHHITSCLPRIFRLSIGSAETQLKINAAEPKDIIFIIWKGQRDFLTKNA